MRGIVKAIKKGYCFISTDDGDFFAHVHDFADKQTFNALQLGDPVEFDEGDDTKGPRAVGVRAVDEAA